jgi:hypothetical protein
VGHFDGGEVSNNFSVAPSVTPNNSGIVGVYQWGTRTNNYWDTFLTSATTCFGDGNTSCTPTENNPTAYYGSNGIPFDSDKLNWSTTNWSPRENNYPQLKWQTE